MAHPYYLELFHAILPPTTSSSSSPSLIVPRAFTGCNCSCTRSNSPKTPRHFPLFGFGWVGWKSCALSWTESSENSVSFGYLVRSASSTVSARVYSLFMFLTKPNESESCAAFHLAERRRRGQGSYLSGLQPVFSEHHHHHQQHWHCYQPGRRSSSCVRCKVERKWKQLSLTARRLAMVLAGLIVPLLISVDVLWLGEAGGEA